MEAVEWVEMIGGYVDGGLGEKDVRKDKRVFGLVDAFECF